MSTNPTSMRLIQVTAWLGLAGTFAATVLGSVLSSVLEADPHSHLADSFVPFAIAGGVIVGLAAVAALVACMRTTGSLRLRTIAALTLLTAALEPLISSHPLAHALLAPVLIAGFCGLLPLGGPPSGLAAASRLPLFARWTPAIITMQIVLGAGYRHKLWGVLPHLAGAMAAALLLLLVPVLLLQKIGNHKVLRRAATAQITVGVTQVALGIGTYLLRLIDLDTTPAFIGFAAAHAGVGALALGSSLVLAIELALCG